MKKTGLGRGLDALFLDNEETIENKENGVNEVNIADIEPDRNQPRYNFDEEKLNELADSIREHGVITPLIVSPIDNGRYRIIAGERRWRAARIAGVNKLPVVIKELSKKEIAEIALVENLQREDLNAIEEAKGYKRLMDEFDMTQAVLAQRVGKSRPVIANAIRLLSLPEEVVDMLEKGEITSGHGKVLLGVEKKDALIKLAEACKNEGISVRELERRVKGLDAPKPQKKPKDINIAAFERKMTEALGRKVKVNGDANKGKVSIEYYSTEDLNKLFDNLIDM